MGDRILSDLGLKAVEAGTYGDGWSSGISELESRRPGDGSLLGAVERTPAEAYAGVVKAAVATFGRWRELPAPTRGELVRRIGGALREHKTPLARLVSAAAMGTPMKMIPGLIQLTIHSMRSPTLSG